MMWSMDLQDKTTLGKIVCIRKQFVCNNQSLDILHNHFSTYHTWLDLFTIDLLSSWQV